MRMQTILFIVLAGVLAIIGLFFLRGFQGGYRLVPATDSAPSAAPMTIEEYVRQNISALSPEQAVLGGTYYVTSIEAHGGAGTVSYEDGHVAHTADFTYSVDEQGRPSVQTFVIRPETR